MVHSSNPKAFHQYVGALRGSLHVGLIHVGPLHGWVAVLSFLHADVRDVRSILMVFIYGVLKVALVSDAFKPQAQFQAKALGLENAARVFVRRLSTRAAPRGPLHEGGFHEVRSTGGFHGWDRRYF